MAAAAVLWASTVIVLVTRLPAKANHDVGNGYFPSIWLPGGTLSNLVLAFIVIAVFQAFATLGLHSAELLVTRSRDEQCLRYAYVCSSSPSSYTQKASKSRKYNSIPAALTSWQSLCLYILKPLIHWLFGSGLSTTLELPNAFGYMDYHYLFGLAAVVLLLAVFATALSHHRPKGPMPSSWGHIQTLVDLIDDWGSGDVEQLRWGDKGPREDGTRQAGTVASGGKVGEIISDAFYR